MDNEDSLLWPVPGDGKGETSRWRGVNLLVDPWEIEDDEVIFAKNIYPVTPEIPATRKALGFVSRFTGGFFGTGHVINSAIVPYVGSPRYLVVQRGIDAGIFAGTTTFALTDGNGALFFDTNAKTTKKPAIAFFQQRLISGIGSPYNSHGGVLGFLDGGGQHLTTFDFLDCNGVGSGQAGPYAPNTLSLGTAKAYSPQVVAPYGDRMFYANFGTGLESLCMFSDSITPGLSAVSANNANALNIPFTVASQNGGIFSRAFPIGGAQDGDRVVAAKEVMLTAVGGPPVLGLLVLKEYSAYLITGQCNQTTDNQSTVPFRGTLTQEKFAFKCGCSSPETVVETPYGVFWAGPDDVWFFPFGQVPQRVGSKIRPALLRTPANFRYRWHAAYFDGSYRLAIDSDGQSIDHDAPCGEQWWLDLRNGAPEGSVEMAIHESAEWWGPQQFQVNTSSGAVALEQGTRNMCLEARVDQPPGLFAVTDPLVVAQFEVPGKVDAAYDPTQIAINVMTGAEIVVDLKSKDQRHGDGMTDKLLQGMETSVRTDIDTILNCDLIMSAGDVVDTQNKGIGSIGPQIGVDPLPWNVSNKRQGVRISANPNTRDVGTSWQLRLYSTAGYYVVKGVNDSIVYAITTGAGSFYVVGTLVAGYYAQISNLGTAIATAMNTINFGFASDADGSGHRRLTFIGAGNWYPAYSAADIAGRTWNGTGVVVVPSAAQYRSTKKLMSSLGIDTTVAGSTLSANQIVAVDLVPLVTIPQLEIAQMVGDVFIFPRRPTG